MLRALAGFAVTSRTLVSTSRDSAAVSLMSSCVGSGWRRWVTASGSVLDEPWRISQARGMSIDRRRDRTEDVTKKNSVAAHRINEQITARHIRLVMGGDGEGDTKSHEVIPTIVARKRARDAGLDLVEMNAKAVPPVCRMLDYDAFRYELRVKEREARKKAVERRRHDQVKES